MHYIAWRTRLREASTCALSQGGPGRVERFCVLYCKEGQAGQIIYLVPIYPLFSLQALPPGSGTPSPPPPPLHAIITCLGVIISLTHEVGDYMTSETFNHA
jgi:hypothetical protein